jgi:hypothetical protein
VRHRITHPKFIADLHVSDDEITDAVHAYLWFDSQCAAALTAYGSHLKGMKGNRRNTP